MWRKALSQAHNAAQVAMCLQQLEKTIAWEKSIMKVVSTVFPLACPFISGNHILSISPIMYNCQNQQNASVEHLDEAF